MPAAVPDLPTLRGFIVGLVPTNPIRAAVDGAMLPLIVFTLLFALAATRLPDERRAIVTGLFRAVSDAMLVIVQWILRLTPIGVFALALGMGKDLGLAAAGAVGYYVLVLSGMLLALTLGVYPVVAIVTQEFAAGVRARGGAGADGGGGHQVVAGVAARDDRVGPRHATATGRASADSCCRWPSRRSS